MYVCTSVCTYMYTCIKIMDKLKLTGRALGRVFNFRSGCMRHTMHSRPGVAKQPSVELKTRPKQLLGSLPLVIALPVQMYLFMLMGHRLERSDLVQAGIDDFIGDLFEVIGDPHPGVKKKKNLHHSCRLRCKLECLSLPNKLLSLQIFF
jgi:hypothetical protein